MGWRTRSWENNPSRSGMCRIERRITGTQLSQRLFWGRAYKKKTEKSLSSSFSIFSTKTGGNESTTSSLPCLEGALSQAVSWLLSYVIYISVCLSLFFFPSIFRSSMVFDMILCPLMWPKYSVFSILISLRIWYCICGCFNTWTCFLFFF